MAEPVVLGVIGGSGLYSMAGPINAGDGGPGYPFWQTQRSGHHWHTFRQAGRLPGPARHWNHISPTEVNYRANLYALKMLGIRKVVSISACGSLREDYAPGQIVVPDQIFDFTRERSRTFFNEGLVVHIGTADPICPELSKQIYDAAEGAGTAVHQGGTLITIEGPRFSTPGRIQRISLLGHVDHRHDCQSGSLPGP